MDSRQIADLTARELARFIAERPRSTALLDRAAHSMPSGVPMAWMRGLYHHPPVFVASGAGARFTDVDGHAYVDFNQADMSSNAGHAVPEMVEAVQERMAAGTQFLLPVEDAIAVSEELARRFGLSHWQYTLSASSANAEAIRLARLASGRERVLILDGSYHGHLGETMLDYHGAGEHESYGLGMARDHGRNTTIVPFNDLESVEAVLARGETACVLVEPALTNVGLVLPAAGFLDGLRQLCDRHGALMVADETHTHMFAFGGLVRLWGLKPHIVVLGKNLAGGVAIGAYGMGAELAEVMDRHLFDHAGDAPGLATGGTLYGNALSLAAARATLDHVLTEAGYARNARLGERLARGIQGMIDEAGLAWRAQHLTSRAGWLYSHREPVTGTQAVEVMDVALSDGRRLYMANRGVWEAIVTAGPAVSFAMTETDIDLYLEVAGAWLDDLLR